MSIEWINRVIATEEAIKHLAAIIREQAMRISQLECAVGAMDEETAIKPNKKGK